MFIPAANYLIRFGYSVLPVWGNRKPDQFKVAAVPWAGYQSRYATALEIWHWYDDLNCMGIAVVCGKVSKNLFVLDIDDPALYDTLEQVCQPLLDTYTVKTPRGWHLYYRMLSDVKTRKFDGGDLKAEGSYVVSSPTDGYTTTHERPPRVLFSDEFDRLMTHIGVTSPGNAQKAGKPPIEANPTPTGSSPTPVEADPTPTDSSPTPVHTHPDTLQAYYVNRAQRVGRNNALFEAAKLARDNGYMQSQAYAELADLHARCQPINNHRYETLDQRLQEAERTIASAYSRPPVSRLHTDGSRIPNALRAALLSQDKNSGTAFLRVYEGLALLGMQPGDTLTEHEVSTKLQPYGIGRRAVLQALKYLAVVPPDNPPPPSAGIPDLLSSSHSYAVDNTTKCDKNKIRRGRPAKYYRFPSIQQLCADYRVKRGPGDPVRLDDLRSPRHYRQALHRELFRRSPQPKRYSLKLLAQRIGLSQRTIQRYNTAIPIQIIPHYEREELKHLGSCNWPKSRYVAGKIGASLDGLFLEDDQGKRYPPKPDVAKWLRRRKRRVWLMRRTTNAYFYLEPEARPPAPRPQPEPPQPTGWQHSPPAQPSAPAQPPPLMVNPASVQPSTQPVKIDVDDVIFSRKPLPPPRTGTPGKRSRRFYTRPLPDDAHEILAQSVYRHTNKDLQLENARRLVDIYGNRAVEKALRLMIALQHKEVLYSPSGFIITKCRDYWRQLNPGQLPPPFQAQPRRRGRPG